MTVEVKFFSGHPGCYLGNIRVSLYNRNDAFNSDPTESAASSCWRWKIAKVFDTGLSVIGLRAVESNSLIPDPEMTDTTNLFQLCLIVGVLPENEVVMYSYSI